MKFQSLNVKFLLILSLMVSAPLSRADDHAPILLQVINQTPFHFAGGIIYFLNSRDYFSVNAASSGEAVTSFYYEGSFFSPSILLELQNHARELCYFSGIDDDLILTISYNGCNDSQPHCLLRCEGRYADSSEVSLTDETTLPYSELRTS